MGGIEVDPDTGAATVAGLFAAGECSGGMHGSNRLGGNSPSDLLVFGRRAGLGAAEYVASLPERPAVSQEDIDAAARVALAPFDPVDDGAENPYTLHTELQQAMNDLVGIIRTDEEITQAIDRLGKLGARMAKVTVEGHRQFNPGWHLALDLYNMLVVSECVAKAALLRTESRGGHTRDDYPAMEADWRNKLLVCEIDREGGADRDSGGPLPRVTVTPKQQVPMREDLLALFDLSEVEKYYTGDELVSHPEISSDGKGQP
jgi:succinate dehydrogenase / fumarate reductase flavoprotein subunit